MADPSSGPIMQPNRAPSGQTVTLTPEQRELWRKTLEPNIAVLINVIGGGAKALYALIDAGRKACPK